MYYAVNGIILDCRKLLEIFQQR